MKVPGQMSTWIVIGFAGLLARSTDACQRAVLGGLKLTAEQKQRILDLHNFNRQAVANGEVPSQPPAGNMLELKWDNELAARAQAWTSSCHSEDHDPQRKLKRFLMGQNIATQWSTRKPQSYAEMMPDFDRAINGWFNEVRAYTYGGISPYQSTGHYTQMIWANTYLIGCGYSFYYDPNKGYTKNYVCNYGPAGNLLSSTPYEKAYPSCHNYKLEFSNKWRGLCDLPSDYIEHAHNYIPYKLK